MRFITDRRQGDLRQRRTIRPIPDFPADFKRPAGVRVLCAAFAGRSGQISRAVLPALIAAFSASVLRCLGAGTRLASTIWPDIGRKPFSRNRALSSPMMSVSLFRKCRMEVSSGVGAPRSKPAKRIQDNRSRSMNSARAPDRLRCVCTIRRSSIETGSNGGRPPSASSP
jgi:hypothetical protein